MAYSSLKQLFLTFIPVHSVLCLALSVHHPHKPNTVQKEKNKGQAKGTVK